MNLNIEKYFAQQSVWPETGRVILAQFDDESIVVYQAYRPEIGGFAAREGCFGGEFKLSRMSWIKPNFLWMMYRCGWATKQGQEVVLAVRILRSAFDTILKQAVHSTYQRELYSSESDWKSALRSSEVRLQWDPDHLPDGGKLERRAIQLGLRGRTLEHYSRDWIVSIEDITDFVVAQRENATSERYVDLMVPAEQVYPVSDRSTIKNLRLDYVD